MTLTELKALIQDLGFNDNCKVVLLVGEIGDNDYELVKVNDSGKIIFANVTVDEIYEKLNHLTYMFPSDTNLTCTFTAHANANTWSTWVEIVDSVATTLSSLFSSYPGHITEFGIESLSEADTIYMVEMAYGNSKTLITSGRFAGATKFQTPTEHIRLWGLEVPAGEKIYYRMKTATVVADTAVVHFRYHLHY